MGLVEDAVDGIERGSVRAFLQWVGGEEEEAMATLTATPRYACALVWERIRGAKGQDEADRFRQQLVTRKIVG